MARFNRPTMATWIGIMTFAVVAIYLFTKLFVTGADGLEFVDVATLDVSAMALWILKAGIIAGAIWIGTIVIGKLTKTAVSRKDIFTLVLLGVAIYFLWTYVISGIWNAPTLEQITLGAGEKLGFFKP